MTAVKALIAVAVAATALSGCGKPGDIVIQEGVGITALRSVCPAVGVPDFTGNVTLFKSDLDRTADALDITAALTNVRSQCNDAGAEVFTTATFDVLAQRRDTRGARSVTLPFYSTVLRGGNAVVSKRLGTITLNFADGQDRTWASGSAGAVVNREAATLPADVRARITARRRSGEEAAAVDPLNQPDIRAAVAQATFELLIGFQLSDDQLAYNATR